MAPLVSALRDCPSRRRKPPGRGEARFGWLSAWAATEATRRRMQLARRGPGRPVGVMARPGEAVSGSPCRSFPRHQQSESAGGRFRRCRCQVQQVHRMGPFAITFLKPRVSFPDAAAEDGHRSPPETAQTPQNAPRSGGGSRGEVWCRSCTGSCPRCRNAWGPRNTALIRRMRSHGHGTRCRV